MIDTGKSIATVADSMSRNGRANTFISTGLTVGSIVLSAAGIWGCKYYFDDLKSKKKKKDREDEEKKRDQRNLEKAKEKAKLAKDVDDHKTRNKEHLIKLRAEKASEKSRKEDTFDTDKPVSPMQSLDDILATEEVSREDLILMYSFLQRGSTLGICGPTNIGKSTFLFQMLLHLATGKCEYPLAAKVNPIKSQKVLLFSTEQTDKEIKYNYTALTDRVPNFKVDTEGTSPAEILGKVKLEHASADSEGMIIAIDNYTSLRKDYKIASLRSLDRELNNMQRENQHTKPITIIKVFHTDSTYREFTPIDVQHIKGSADIVNLTKNFIFLTPCREGHSYRILKERKNKIDGPKDTVSILKYAETTPHQYVYYGEAIEDDVLPLYPIKKTASNNGADSNTPCRRGPKEKYTEAELREMWEEKEAGFTWREVMESRGLVYNENKEKGIKRAMDRHNIRPKKS